MQSLLGWVRTLVYSQGRQDDAIVAIAKHTEAIEKDVHKLQEMVAQMIENIELQMKAMRERCPGQK